MRRVQVLFVAHIFYSFIIKLSFIFCAETEAKYTGTQMVCKFLVLLAFFFLSFYKLKPDENEIDQYLGSWDSTNMNVFSYTNKFKHKNSSGVTVNIAHLELCSTIYNLFVDRLRYRQSLEVRSGYTHAIGSGEFCLGTVLWPCQ